MAYTDAPRPVPDGQFTQTVYGAIRDARWQDAIDVLLAQLQEHPDSRAALSLLGHCYFQTSQFELAAQMYEALVRCHPSIEDYKLYYAQSLHKAGLYAEAAVAAARVGGEGGARGAAALAFAIAYDQGDLAGCRRLLDALPSDDADGLSAAGCLLFKEGDFAAAARKFEAATAAAGRRPELLYNAALCAFKARSYGAALKLVAEIVEARAAAHPELGVGSYSERIAAGGGATAPALPLRSVGNSQALADTALVEALNLKAAVEMALGNMEGARAALGDMPPRSEEELDPVSLHNSALAQMASDPGGGFKKLNHLLGTGSFPPETFPNLLLLYAAPHHGFLDLAADVMADNPALVSTHLSKDLAEFLGALLLKASSPDEALARLDELARRHLAGLRALTKRLQDARLARDNEAIRGAIQAYDDALEAYVPVLMAMTSIYWEKEQWGAVEALLVGAGEHCSEVEAWRLNMGHVAYMQERYADAVRHYQPLVVARAEALLELPAILLANLCVCYIMTSQNEEAEELMRRVEAVEEEEAEAASPSARGGGGSGGGSGGGRLHLAIINLVIGTLYCSKGNYEFGVSRVIKSLEPLAAKLSTDTWFYAKRPLLALLEGLAKHCVAFKSEGAWGEVEAFLKAAEQAGGRLPAAFGGGGGGGEGRSVGEEARLMCWLLVRLAEQR